MEEGLHRALAPLHDPGDLLVSQFLTKSQHYHLLLILGEGAHRRQHIRSPFQCRKGNLGARLRVHRQFQVLVVTHHRFAPVLGGDGVARYPVQPGRESNSTPFEAMDVLQGFVKSFGNNILREGPVSNSVIGIGENRIDITFVQGAKGDRIGTRCLNEIPFRFKLLGRRSQSSILHAGLEYALYTYNAPALVSIRVGRKSETPIPGRAGGVAKKSFDWHSMPRYATSRRAHGYGVLRAPYDQGGM